MHPHNLLDRRIVIKGRVACVLCLASVVAALPAIAGADTTIDFEGFPEGSVVSDQFADLGGAGQGVVFGPLPVGAGNGLRPVIRIPPAGQAESGTQVADIATCQGEGCGEVFYLHPITTGTVSIPRSQVSVRVGYLGPASICTAVQPDLPGCAVVKLRVFDIDGNVLGETSARVTRGAGVHTLLSFTTPESSIVGFEISARPTTDDNKQIAIDDLSFDTPVAPQSPDFTLNPASTDVVVKQGGAVKVPIAIGRLGGSSGGIGLAAGVLPDGVSASFVPNPATGSSITLTLSAEPGAPLGGATLNVTGTPGSEAAGPGPRSFPLRVTVDPDCRYVSTADALVEALADGFKCIFVASDAAIDLTDVHDPRVSSQFAVLEVPDGVTLMSGRSPTRFGGILFMRHRVGDKVWMLYLGSNTRVVGLRLRGYYGLTEDRDDRTRAIQIDGRGGVVIENNEISFWPSSAISINGPIERDQAPLITRNFLHHNVQCNLGYGVVVGDGGFARIERNLFAYNRHDVAGSGDSGDGFIADLNFSLTDAPRCGGLFKHYNQHYDMHGEHGGYGGRAGTFMLMRRNTIRGAQSYHGGYHRRPAFMLRGTPEHRAIFAGNAVHNPDAMGRLGAVRVKKAGVSAVSLIASGRLIVRNNRLSLDTADELAVGDFNGDNRDDVFQSVGTLWAYSPSGRREWHFLRGSSVRLARLGLGDFDGDGKTDVFTQRGDRWLVSKGGVSGWTELPTGSPIDIKHYRFGDFDGDGRTDVFRADGSRFFYSSAAATEWEPLAASRLTIGKLRFGDFDGDGRTDVFSLANGQWSVSHGGRSTWERLNRKLSGDLERLVFADFTGDGRTDVARTANDRWQMSEGGTTEWRTIQHWSAPLHIGMLFGDFTGEGRDDVLQHAVRRLFLNSLDRWRLVTGGDGVPVVWTDQDMR